MRLGACLSLTGRYARFGRQAAAGLEAWRALAGGVELIVEDDASSAARVGALIGDLSSRCDLLLGPYSSELMRAAARSLEGPALIWNHGGAGEVTAAGAVRVVSVLTPAERYAAPFVLRPTERVPLWIEAGRGAFGRQVAAGAEALARVLGLAVTRTRPDAAAYDLLSAGVFEDDVATVVRAQALPRPPRRICSVAAGVREFAGAVGRPAGVLGVAQWFPGSGEAAELGPDEAEFLAAYRRLTGADPDYPAVQAAAAATLATHCAAVAGGTSPDALWAAATALDTSTLFGGFHIDPRTGAQLKHETTLVGWTGEGLSRLSQ